MIILHKLVKNTVIIQLWFEFTAFASWKIDGQLIIIFCEIRKIFNYYITIYLVVFSILKINLTLPSTSRISTPGGNLYN